METSFLTAHMSYMDKTSKEKYKHKNNHLSNTYMMHRKQAKRQKKTINAIKGQGKAYNRQKY